MENVSQEHEKDSKPEELLAVQKQLQELNALHEKLRKLWNNRDNQIKQDFPDQFDRMLNLLQTSYQRVTDQKWVQTCDDLVKVSQDLKKEKKRLVKILETWRNKYKWQPELEKLHATYVQVLQCFAKDSSQIDVHLLQQNLDTPSHLSLSGRVIQREFGPEQFHVLCQYLRTLSDYVKKDPTTGEYMVQAVPKPRLLIQHKHLALNDTLIQLKETVHLVEQIKAKLGDNPTNEQLDRYLSDQPQKYTYICIGLYQHSADANTQINLHYWYKPMQKNIGLPSLQGEDDCLKKLGLEKKVEIVAYGQQIGHIYFNCHSFTFTDGKGGWLTDKQVESILQKKFKKVWKGNIIRHASKRGNSA